MKILLWAVMIAVCSTGIAIAQQRDETLTPPTFIFPAPTHVTCDTLVGESLLLRFAPVPGATGYQVEWSALPSDRSAVIEERIFVIDRVPPISVEGMEMMGLVVRALDAYDADAPPEGSPQGRWSQPCSVPIPIK